MKLLRLLALAIAATAWCASVAFACDGAKTSAASASSCGTKSAGVKTANADACGSKSTATTAVAASASKKGAHAAGADCAASGACPMSAEACKAMMASGACTAEMQAACGAKGVKTASATKASKSTKTAGMDCCATGAKSAKAASADGCSMHTMAGHAGMDCAVCADEMACDDDVKATGARAQVVPLRNGSMIVYMLDGDENVRGLQAAVARHNSRVVAALQGDAKLCTACKKLRGALASGKLVREVVNVERGCQVLITSSDRSIVEQVHRCTNAQVASRTKT